MEDVFIAQPFTILNHPARRLNKKVQSQYVSALGVLLGFTSKGNQTVRFVYETWISSIFGYVFSPSWSAHDDLSRTEGFNFGAEVQFTPKFLRLLLFDCFYLNEKAGVITKELVLERLYGIVGDRCSRDMVDYTYHYFNGQNNGSKLSVNLRLHRARSLSFCQQNVKRVLVVATMSAGKSTLINALVGEKVNRVKATVCTSAMRCIFNAQSQYGATMKMGEKLLYTEDAAEMQSGDAKSLAIGFMSSRLANRRICIIDTPGVNYSGDLSHGQITRKLIRENKYDLLLFVSNAQQFLINDELEVIRFVLKECKKKLVFVLNQCDMFSPKDDSIEETLSIFEDMIRKEMTRHIPIVPISGFGAYTIRHAERMGKLIDDDDLFEYEQTKKKLEKAYYNLPSYISEKSIGVIENDSILDRTGITILENIISML